MAAAIDRFLQRPTLDAVTGLAVGYDFLKDQAEAIAREMEKGGVATERLINDYWTAADLKQRWLENRHDLDSINAHFEHWQAIPADGSSQVLTAADVQGSQHVSGTVVFSVGCHSGLPVPDEQATDHKLDFAQALVGKGATYLANTGYGYGDANAIGYSERLMTLFAQHLRADGTVGQALRGAEIEYFNTVGVHALTPYDEKVLAVATLYGLPMYQVHMPGTAAAAVADTGVGQLSAAGPCPPGLQCRQVVIAPTYDDPHTVSSGDTTRTYYSVGGETQVAPGQPIQPRTGISVTLQGTTARGAVFEGGRYAALDRFSPVLTQPTSDDTRSAGTPVDPGYDAGVWTPSAWGLINTVRTAEGLQQRLIVIPAQYRAATAAQGVERLFEEMTYTLYYATATDIIPPSIWKVQDRQQGETAQTVLVDVTDFGGIVRVVVAYTSGSGEWLTADLTRDEGDPSQWGGTLPREAGLTYFVQAVDGAGNVAVSDNRGRYFTLLTRTHYLPVIARSIR